MTGEAPRRIPGRNLRPATSWCVVQEQGKRNARVVGNKQGPNLRGRDLDADGGRCGWR